MVFLRLSLHPLFFVCRPPRLYEMADAGDGMHKEHPRSAIAHHFFDALAHLGLVAMHLAVGTKSLCLHKRALVTAHSRIIIQCLTLFAETPVFLSNEGRTRQLGEDDGRKFDQSGTYRKKRTGKNYGFGYDPCLLKGKSCGL